jgi:hypothetical protein
MTEQDLRAEIESLELRLQAVLDREQHLRVSHPLLARRGAPGTILETLWTRNSRAGVLRGPGLSSCALKNHSFGGCAAPPAILSATDRTGVSSRGAPALLLHNAIIPAINSGKPTSW